MSKITVLAILGPTAAGKTEVALSMAEEYGYEILSCDSRQIYRHMGIGTAKPSLEEMGRVRHHLIDILDPSKPYSAFAFAEDALRIIREAHKIGKKILICGGTGLYYDILVNGGGSSLDEADLDLRDRMLEEARECGSASLHDRLRGVDPEAAEKIHPNDLQRVLRALDVYYRTGRPLSSLRKDRLPPEDIDFRAVVISLPREELYGRINRRVDVMVGRGLWSEFTNLREMGYTEASPGMACVGYRELFGVEKGEMGLEQAAELIKRNTRRYAKRQMTWFRNRAPGALIDVSDYYMSARSIIDLTQNEGLRTR
ncbi:MAG: tRNA (adenosine(37)-N6)-dimethylallyltransferase MiaA [Chitinispirillales bacterium]|jgi:tRNA dimethylallyltransferase|nr:tRNA (adenosine(37)-N6)-dimethylallyltransferase MiaA [Chitinispirillales bacterium]